MSSESLVLTLTRDFEKDDKRESGISDWLRNFGVLMRMRNPEIYLSAGGSSQIVTLYAEEDKYRPKIVATRLPSRIEDVEKLDGKTRIHYRYQLEIER